MPAGARYADKLLANLLSAQIFLRSAGMCVKMYTVVYFVEPPHRSANPAQSPVDTLNRIP